MFVQLTPSKFCRFTNFWAGQQHLGQACPICLHEPVNAEDCKPNKALRTTVKVWLKKRGQEREAALRRELASRAPPTPVIPATPTINEASNQQTAHESTTSTAGLSANETNEHLHTSEISEARPTAGATLGLEEQHALAEAQKDIPQPSIEVSFALLCADRSG